MHRVVHWVVCRVVYGVVSRHFKSKFSSFTQRTEQLWESQAYQLIAYNRNILLQQKRRHSDRQMLRKFGNSEIKIELVLVVYGLVYRVV